MNNIDIISIEYGKSTLPESAVLQNGREDILHPIVFIIYLVKTDKKLILVDAGCETMPGFVMKDFCGAVNALKKIGINPEDITDVLITHAHHDHIECVKYFENATVYIQCDEYENGKNYFTDKLNVKTFRDEESIAEGVKIVKCGGHSTGSSVVLIDNGTSKYVIAGDEIYSKKCIEMKIPTGSSYNVEKSADFIQKYCSGEYTVLLCHDR